MGYGIKKFLDFSRNRLYPMCMGIKVSTVVDEKIWEEFQDFSEETHQSISGLVTEALEEFLRKKRVRPDFLKQMEKSAEENEELGKLLAK